MGNTLLPFQTQALSNWVAAILSLFLVSLLYKENPFYRLAEHIFVGTSAAHSILTTWQNNLKPRITNDIMTNGEYWMLLPICLGLLIYFNLIPSQAWLARLPMSYWIGYSAAMGLSTRTVIPFFTEALASMKPLIVINNGTFSLFDSVTNIIFMVCILGTLVVFFFTIEHTGLLAPAARVGRYAIMLCLGASFGNTVASRFSLLIGRFEFFLRDWLKVI